MYYFFYSGPFSQWHRGRFTVDGVEYCTAEQYMMAGKARFFEDTVALDKILKETNPRKQKALGRNVQNFNESAWNSIARDIVYRGNYEKFTQNPDFLSLLKSTGDALLVEASPDDVIWGIGLGMDDPAKEDPKNWRGTNWLGEVLTKVRADIAAGVMTTEHLDFGWSPGS
jgi:ribA/ribD-fused uncharacterized protein